MKTKVLIVLFVAVLALGCARVRVEAPKEAIKVDISMRLDVYQHVTKDIDEIENIVSGNEQPKAPTGGQSMLPSFIGTAYAQEGLGADVESAALRRKDRRPQLLELESQGVVGENRLGLVSIRRFENASESTKSLVIAENNDRMAIYEGVAKKNGTSVDEVQKIYAKRLQKDAPAGTPIEALNESSGRYSWQVK